MFPQRITLHRGNPVDSLPKLLKNELVEGEVVESHSSNAALLLIKGKRIMARTTVPLAAGNTVKLRVEETGPLPILRLIGWKSGDSRPANLPLVLSAMDDNIWRSVFTWSRQHPLQSNLASLLQKVLKDWGATLSGKKPGVLKKMIDRSGLHWEAKLGQLARQKGTGEKLTKLAGGDLKGEALRALAQGEEEHPLIKRLLSVIEEVQILNLGMLEKGKMFLPLPLEFPNGWHTVAQLLIQLPSRREDPSAKEEKRPLHITLLLTMSSLGSLRIQVTLLGKTIEGVCMTGSEDTKAILEKHLSSLLQGLGEKGFSVRSFPCILGDVREVEHSLLITSHEGERHSFDRVA